MAGKFPALFFKIAEGTDIKLFQAADLLYPLEPVRLKLENNMFSKFEKTFFGNISVLKKNYIKHLCADAMVLSLQQDFPKPFRFYIYN